MKVTYYGQSCFLVELAQATLLFDPFISGNELAKDKVNIDEIKADYILLTHGHQDHVLDAERIAKNNNAKIIAIFEIVSWYSEKGIEGHPMNLGGKFTFDFGTVRMVQAVHSSVLPDGTYGGSAAGFVIETEEGTFYHAGDTALTMDMKLLPMICPPLSFAILPIGDNFTMGVDDALLCSDFIECNQIIGCHFDTFGYIKIDHAAAKAKFEAQNKTLVLPEINMTFSIQINK